MPGTELTRLIFRLFSILILTSLLLSGAGLQGPSVARAQEAAPPGNDDFDDALLIDSLPYTSASIDTTGATTAADDPSMTCWNNQHHRSVWFDYTATASGPLIADTAPSNYDTVLEVWTGSRGALVSQGCNDGYDFPARIQFQATSGTTYHIEVASFEDAGGNLTLALTPPDTDWIIRTPMTVGRRGLAAASVGGKIYVIGGESSGGTTGSVEAYDPSTDTWSTRANKPTAVSRMSAAALGNMIYVPGGWTGSNSLQVMERYNTETDTWTTLAPMPEYQSGHAVAALGTKVYVMGGQNGGGGMHVSDRCYAYDTVANSWSMCGWLNHERSYAAAAVVNGKIYVVGGQDVFETPDASVEVFTPPNTWTLKASMQVPRSGAGAVGYFGSLYVCGGSSSLTPWPYEHTCEKYNPAANTWTAFDPLNVARGSLAMAAAQGKLYAVGGIAAGAAGSYLAINEELSVATVTISGNTDVGGVTLAYSGGPAASNSSGDYSLAVPSGWSGTVTPSKSGYIFAPPSRTYTNVTADMSAQDYVATLGNSATFSSQGPYDGHIIESGETSGAGGAVNSTLRTFNLGDSDQRRQYRSILTFGTASLPDNAVITSARLTLRLYGVTGVNPFFTLGKIWVDIRSGTFGTRELEIGDFNTAPSRHNVASFNSRGNLGAYSTYLSSDAFDHFNKTGLTQMRLRFWIDDDNDSIADYLKFYTGDHPTAVLRPTLVIEYYVP